MHIPDGYLSPQTYVPAATAMLPFWAIASARVKRSLRLSQVPMLALGAAFSFVIMMFNIPIPGGTTGHAIGSVLVAILLGPWAAVIAVSLALVVQAVLFGDGGITAVGANCLNMAVIAPFAGWWTYRLLVGNSTNQKRRVFAGAAAGYVGLNASAFATAVMFGIQPYIAHDGAGRALYSPFGLEVAIPAMMGSHILVFGFVEAVVTGLVLSYVYRSDSSFVQPVVANTPPVRKYAIGLLALVILAPIGIFLPDALKAGAAWGEWGIDEIKKEAGYVPAKMAEMDGKWKAPLPDYALPGQEEGASKASQGTVYVLSGLIGFALLTGTVLGARRLIAGKDEPTGDSGLDAAAS